MPGFIVDADTGRQIACVQPVDVSERLFAHRRFDFATLTVDLVQDGCVMQRDVHVVRKQAFDSDRDVFESSCRVDPGPGHESEIGAGRPCELTAGLA